MFDDTIRDGSEEWTTEVWREAYDFPNGKVGKASRNDTYIDNKFFCVVDLKDVYLVSDCRDARNRRLLEFIIPIIHPDTPTRITITIENTIFRALDEGRPIDCGIVFWDLAQRLVARVGKPKLTPISPFLFHLYHGKDIFIEKEDTNY